MATPSFHVSMTLVILTLLSLNKEVSTTTYQIAYSCSNTLTFTPNSTYQSNLYQLLSFLSTNATREDGFYNTTVGQNASNLVYGLFLCRGDLTTQNCQECVATATQDVINQCPIEKEAVIWYEECMIRYSDQSFFSTLNTMLKIYVPSRKNISDPDQFYKLLMLTMNESVSQVANASTGAKKFATKEANFMGSQILYTLEQCTPDISNSDCIICIRDAISVLPICCSGLQGARVLLPSCRIRYEIYPFYRMLNARTSPPMPAIIPPPPPGSLQFDFATVEAATAKFSDDNKLGAGGFGEVYKGTLPNKQEVAVKRLSKRSGQGEGEFKNEIELVAKLHHKNLVRLLGFCLEGEEKILIYEFVPNKSLDYFLYDPQRQGQLDWSKRYKIIKGIARGILYLHEDSRLRIIHRDLKSSNVLLDGDMNPKISDFGLAKLFETDQTRGHTRRIAGTLGYMPPEYAIRGQFSVKSDVYSFGVLILEILSGNKINSFYQSDGGRNLLSYAWKHWSDGTPLELLDLTLRDSYSAKEFMKCLQIGLLCVQEDPARRPTIASIVLMLNKSRSVIFPSLQQPAYCSGTHQNMPLESVNETPMTDVSPR
ncbi:cysteine-rich receptor-like protein kinase 10 isoform X2 [Alnus glutinosa]|uniref:cysteine-rich receptor-like protein kinase 10 isoform X2 n=1 Tax=Alnus glutinosa TaxID=3517 RepID=UPI002D796A72|nr:cysteine-rich receptor-like protein kinase 10 isoform X2 [Alnus glutinosa]